MNIFSESSRVMVWEATWVGESFAGIPEKTGTKQGGPHSHPGTHALSWSDGWLVSPDLSTFLRSDQKIQRKSKLFFSF